MDKMKTPTPSIWRLFTWELDKVFPDVDYGWWAA